MESNAITRLKRVARKQTTTLTHYGRKTGTPHEVTIWFVLDDDKLYIGTANVNRQWVRNVQKTPQIKLSMGGETFSGTARFLTDRAEHDRNLQGSGNDPPECCPGKPSCHPAYDALVNK